MEIDVIVADPLQSAEHDRSGCPAPSWHPPDDIARFRSSPSMTAR